MMKPTEQEYKNYINWLKGEVEFWKTQYYEKVGEDYFNELENKGKKMTNLEKTEAILKAKTLMTELMQCVKDVSLPLEDRKYYQSEYLQVSANFLILMRG
jgi:hypothetical protein